MRDMKKNLNMIIKGHQGKHDMHDQAKYSKLSKKNHKL